MDDHRGFFDVKSRIRKEGTMIILGDLMLEAERLKARAAHDRKPVNPERLAMLTGAEIIDKETLRKLMVDSETILEIAGYVEAHNKPAIMLIDTGMAARDAMVLINTTTENISGRALVALALAHSALEPATLVMPGTKHRMVIIALPEANEREELDRRVFDAGTPVRIDPRGKSLPFRPVAEAGINRLAMNLLISDPEIHIAAEWIGSETTDERSRRLADMLSLRTGIPADWAAKAINRHEKPAASTKRPYKHAI